LDCSAEKEIDATGLVVAPGFIDVHTHADEVAEMPLAENFVRMGVTTIVAGNCGGSALNIKRFFSEIEETNVAVNVATLIGHNSVREKAMGGDFDRAQRQQQVILAIRDRIVELGPAKVAAKAPAFGWLRLCGFRGHHW
jgi:N-acyl-D-amino-acid deacylase